MVGLIQHVFSNTIGNATGTVSIWNTAGVSTTAAATNLVRPQDWNSTHNLFVSLSGNTAGQSNLSGTNIVMAGGNNITLSGTTAAGAATVSVVGYGGVTDSAYAPLQLGNNTAFTAPALNTLYLQPFIPLASEVIASQVNVVMELSYTSSSAGSKSYSNTWSLCLYSQETGGNSTILGSVTSVSGGFTATRFSTGASFTINVNGNTTTTSGSGAFAGAYIVNIPMNVTLSGGQLYYLGVANSTVSAGTSAGLAVSLLALTNIASTFGQIGTNASLAATNSSIFLEFDPVFFSATSGAWPSTIGSNALSRNTSGGAIYVEFVNQGIF